MNVQRITARTARDAMREVRETLGADAVILSNRPVEGGVEIIAMPPEAVAALAAPVVEPEARRAAGTPAPATQAAVTQAAVTQAAVTQAAVTQAAAAAVVELPPPAPSLFAEPCVGVSPIAAGAVLAATGVSDPGPAAPSLAASGPAAFGPSEPARPDPLVSALLAEIRSLHEKLEHRIESRIDDLAWRDLPGRNPAGAALMRELLSAGFSPALARRLLENLPAGHDAERALVWAKDVLVQELAVLPNEAGLIDSGGVFAIMGPTGAGKTTTTAKLAARFVVRHGADKLALLTTDGYRIGGHEQLRIYGKILGVPVHAVRDAADLQLALAELRGKHTVLIDTVGMSQRDRAVAEQVEMLASAGQPVKRLLVLNATSHGDTLNEVVHAYKGRGLTGAILSKIDEAASLGPALDCALRHQLTLHYIATGQRVPEDLHPANRQYLVHRAFRARPAVSPWALDDEDLPYAMAGAGEPREALHA